MTNHYHRFTSFTTCAFLLQELEEQLEEKSVAHDAEVNTIMEKKQDLELRVDSLEKNAASDRAFMEVSYFSIDDYCVCPSQWEVSMVKMPLQCFRALIWFKYKLVYLAMPCRKLSACITIVFVCRYIHILHHPGAQCGLTVDGGRLSLCLSDTNQ